jgi:hypothetical protein
VPVEAKPIFRPDVVRLPLLGFNLPDQAAQRREKPKKWVEIISTSSVGAPQGTGGIQKYMATWLPTTRSWTLSRFRTRSSDSFGIWSRHFRADRGFRLGPELLAIPHERFVHPATV